MLSNANHALFDVLPGYSRWHFIGNGGARVVLFGKLSEKNFRVESKLVNKAIRKDGKHT